MGRHTKQSRYSFPENLFCDIMVEDLVMNNPGRTMMDSQRETLCTAFNSLDLIERAILIKRYQENKIFRVIGEELGLSGGKCQQLCSKALRKLRNPEYVRRYREK